MPGTSSHNTDGLLYTLPDFFLALCLGLEMGMFESFLWKYAFVHQAAPPAEVDFPRTGVGWGTT